MASFLESQEAEPFFVMGERYGALYRRMADLLERLDPEELERRAARRAAIDGLPEGTAACSFLDVDATVAAFCEEQGRPLPTQPEAAVALHIEAIERWLEGAGRRQDDNGAEIIDVCERRPGNDEIA